MDKTAPIDDKSTSNQGENSPANTPAESRFGIIVYQHDRLVCANMKAAKMLGCTPQNPLPATISALLSHIHSDDRTLFRDTLTAVQSSAFEPIHPDICLIGAAGHHQIADVLVNMTLHRNEPAVQIHLIDAARRKPADDILRRQENEVMRDVITALAMAADLNQTLEIILVNLRSVLQYDRASLFLIDKDEHFVLAGNTDPEESSAIPARGFNDPIVLELQRTKRPLVVPDIQTDERFSGWPDMQPLHGWIGAPLIVGDKVTGFLSLSSLEIGTYDPSDADVIQGFTSQLAAVLEKDWLHEQSHRRTEELEVLSRFSIALGRAEGRGDILAAIMDQTTDFFGAVRGAFLFPDETETLLQVKFSLDQSLIGLIHPQADSLLWQVYRSGRPAVITDWAAGTQAQTNDILEDLFADMRSAVLIPLKSAGTTTGVLCFGFEDQRDFSIEDMNFYNAIAEIAGSSLHRAILLEALENQVDIRNQHLSTLYAINAFAGERRDLADILEQVLRITLEAMNNRAGAIFLLNKTGTELRPITQQNLPPELHQSMQTIRPDEPHWNELIHAPLPQILRSNDVVDDFPAALGESLAPGTAIILTAPIRAKGQPLGLLINIGDHTQEYNDEDIVLFATIADQIGIFVERARLINKAEQAAVVEERQRLARELHDSVTQLLYSQILFSGASLKVLKQDNIPLTRQYLARIEKAAQQALKEMRLLVFELRPSDQLDEGLADAIHKRLDAVEKRSGMETRLILEGDLLLDETAELSIYRIVQEALNNTLKHAGAAEVTIALRQHQESLEVEVVDDGCGFNYEECLQSGGVGLASMLERTGTLGGTMEVDTAPGKGTRVRVTIGALP